MDTTSDSFTDWLDGFFRSYYRHRPANGTFIGMHEHDHQLLDCSDDGLGALLEDTQTMRGQLNGLNSDELTAAQQIDHRLAGGFLDIQEWELSSGHFQRGNPCYYTGEMVFGVMSLFLRDFAPIDGRVESAVARLETIPAFLRDARAQVQSAPPEWTQRAIRECDGALAFFSVGIDMVVEQYGLDPHLRKAADGAVKAVREHRQHLTDVLLQSPTELYGCGGEAFDLLMHRGHFLEMSASDIVRYAEEQADEAMARLNEGARTFGASDWREALAGLAEVRPTVDRYYQSYGDIWEACRSAATAHNLLTWPDYPVRYIPRPEWSREAAPYLYFLFYRSPAPYDDAPVIDYLVTPVGADMPVEEQDAVLRATNDSVIKLNHVVHHGSIGHHVQNWHAFRAESRIGQMAAVDCASRIAMFCGGTMAEGWSSYATEMMGEVGFLTPLERYSQHHARLRMAARAIVDVKLHNGEYSLSDAAGYYRARVGMSPGAALDEAVKNSMFPGAAMIYLIGTDIIHRLRHDLSSDQGSDLNLRAFHDRFLSYGSIPVELIAKLMREEIIGAQ